MPMKTDLQQFFLLFSFLCLFSLPSFATTDVQRLSKKFTEGQDKDKLAVVKELAYAGISDKQLFDLIAAEFDRTSPSANTRNSISYAAHMAKGLTYSGQEHYKNHLLAASKTDLHKKLKKYITKNEPLFAKYQRWNPIISSKKDAIEGLSSTENHTLNMLRSSDLELKRIGARRAHNGGLYHKSILAFLNTDILNGFQSVTKDKLSVDTMAWEMKALAGSKVEEYKSTINTVKNDASNKHLRKYAKRYLKYYQ